MTPETIDTIPPVLTPEEIRAQMRAERRREYIAGMRMLADVLEANPHLKLPHDGCVGEIAIIPDWHKDREELAAWARVIPGRKTKEEGAGGKHFNLVGAFRGLKVKVICQREEVCEKVVLGTREVTEEVPDPEAVAALPKVATTRTEEIVEWRCHPVLDGDR